MVVVGVGKGDYEGEGQGVGGGGPGAGTGAHRWPKIRNPKVRMTIGRKYISQSPAPGAARP